MGLKELLLGDMTEEEIEEISRDMCIIFENDTKKDDGERDWE